MKKYHPVLVLFVWISAIILSWVLLFGLGMTFLAVFRWIAG